MEEITKFPQFVFFFSLQPEDVQSRAAPNTYKLKRVKLRNEVVWGVEVPFYSFVTSGLVINEWFVSLCPGRLIH
jgi:hypothetical protein